MNSAIIELVQSWRLISKSGQRVLAVYGASLVLLSGLDAAALVLASRIFTNSNESLNSSLPLIATMVGLFVGRTLLSSATSWWAIRSMAAEEVHLGNKNLETLISKDFVGSVSETDYYNAVDRGPTYTTQGVVIYAVTIAAESSTAVIILGTLLVLDFPTAITSSIYFLLVALLQHRAISQASARAGETTATEISSVYESLSDAFSLRKVLHTMPSQSFFQSVEEKRTRLALSRSKVAYLGTLPRYTMELVLSIGLIVVAGVAYIVSGESGAVEAIAIFGIAGFRLLPAINRIQGLVLMLFSTIPQARLARLQQPLRSTSSSHISKPGNSSVISFRDVTFTYPGSSDSALSAVTFDIKQGLEYAIVGPSGAGKTTLVDLALGLLSPSSGIVEKQPNLRVGYVPQDTHLARTGLSENISLEWNVELIDTRLLEIALKEAALDGLKNRFSDSSNTRMSDSITSGGQRQRIGLARALYRAPNLLVLDEVTSALDAETENFIMSRIRDLVGRCTVVIVAHRLTTVQHADQVIYLDGGKVLGVGTFDELRRSIPQLQRQIDLGTLNLND